MLSDIKNEIKGFHPNKATIPNNKPFAPYNFK